MANQKVLRSFISSPTEARQCLDVDLWQVESVMDPFKINTPCKVGIRKRCSRLIQTSLKECPEQEHGSVLIHSPAFGVELVGKEVGPWVTIEFLQCRLCPVAGCK